MIENFELAKQVAEEYKIPLALLCAVIEKESNGRHIYGHDTDGVYSTRGRTVVVDGLSYGVGANVPVTPRNFAEFERRVLAGEKSNGVGIMQITYAGPVRADGTRDGGYLRVAREKGLDLSKELDNIRMGADIIRGHLQKAGGVPSKDAVVYVGTKYNGRSTYGEDLWVKYNKWVAELDRLADPLLVLTKRIEAIESRLAAAEVGIAAAEAKAGESVGEVASLELVVTNLLAKLRSV